MLFVGGLWTGSTTLQRLKAFEHIPTMHVTQFDTGDRWGAATLIDRVAHKLRRPIDWRHINQRLLLVAADVRPDVVFFDNTKVIRAETLRRLRDQCGARTVFYTPDDVLASFNNSRQLEASWEDWSVVFTTKDYNVPEYAARGVRMTHVVGNAFDPGVHRPMDPQEVGRDFERFDLAFAGAVEKERRDAINYLALKGMRVVVFGDIPAWGQMHPNVSLRPAAWELEYSRAMHMAKLALCFLRTMVRDAVTTRSFEIPAMGRPMAAERTIGHDAVFSDGVEYLGFSSHAELASTAATMISDEPRRRALGRAARDRCLRSGYSTLDRARQMTAIIESVLVGS